jgi:hypothetical protein
LSSLQALNVSKLVAATVAMAKVRIFIEGFPLRVDE